MEVESHTEQLAHLYLRSVDKGNARIGLVSDWDGAHRAARDLCWARVNSSRRSALNGLTFGARLMNVTKQAAFDTALSVLTETVAHHPAQLKFGLFQVGRWPLTITRKQFFLF